MQNKHITVLLKESIRELVTSPSGTYVDGTLGGGGHLNELINTTDGATIIAFDIDKTAIESYLQAQNFEFTVQDKVYSATLEKSKIYIINDSFDQLGFYISFLQLQTVDGILLDLGWSTNQIEGIEGLSFSDEQAQLDMRMSENLGVTAADLINGLGKSELKKLFAYADFYGHQANILVEKITTKRSAAPILLVGELNEIITEFKNESSSRDSIESISARIYLALRIAVNDEFGNLKRILTTAETVLAKQGRLAVITFHSGEEKIIKEFSESTKSFNHKLFNQKEFIQPTVSELRTNLSSRSAKLWIFEKR